MSLKARRIIFYLLTLLFFVSGAVAVFYSNGWRPNLATLTWRETGSIFLRSTPIDADLLLDGKAVENQSWILQSGTLISGLSSDSYEVRISKNGYSPWSKRLVVRPLIVTEASHVILPPESLPASTVKRAEDFWMRNGAVITKDEMQRLEAVDWLSDGQSAIFYRKEDDTYYEAKIDGLDSFLNLSVLFENLKESRLSLPGIVPIAAVKPHPFDTNKFIIASRNALYTMDVLRFTIEIIADNAVSDVAADESRIFWIEKDGLWTYNLILKTKSKIADLSLPARKVILAPDGAHFALLMEDDSLTTGRLNDSRLTSIAPYAQQAVFSPDGKKIAFTDAGGRINVYFLEDIVGDIQKKAGETSVLEINRGSASNLIWHQDSFHLFAQAGGALLFTEIDERPPLNSYILKDGISKYAYDPKGGALYVLEKGTLSKLDFGG
ncbi:MAG: hypothetical protein HY456_00090 [Parcubacteria group bacterium]|nr:hypothetical protein [Parcubacteria group bacterium]